MKCTDPDSFFKIKIREICLRGTGKRNLSGGFKRRGINIIHLWFNSQTSNHVINKGPVTLSDSHTVKCVSVAARSRFP